MNLYGQEHKYVDVTGMKINYYGYFTPFGGYGIANLNWVKFLKRRGVDVSVFSKLSIERREKEFSVLDKEMQGIFGEFDLRDIGIVESTPFDFGMNQSRIKIANTMAETDEIGKDWVDAINKMDYVIVPNMFYRKVFEKCGVEKPIKIISHGVDLETFPYYDRPKRHIFTFGMCGYLNDRKSVYEVVEAFVNEFGPNEPVRLMLHSTDPAFGYYRKLKDPRISVTVDLKDFKEINKFYRKLDAFVFPSKAEGIGYPPREAMATGLPTIVMNYSGLEDIAWDYWTYPINPDGFTRSNPVIEQPGNWAKVNIKELMFQMRAIYSDKNEAKRRGLAAHNQIKINYSWENKVNHLVELIDEVSKM